MGSELLSLPLSVPPRHAPRMTVGRTKSLFEKGKGFEREKRAAKYQTRGWAKTSEGAKDGGKKEKEHARSPLFFLFSSLLPFRATSKPAAADDEKEIIGEKLTVSVA